MKNEKRGSNFELFRVICMLLIVMCHFAVHSNADSSSKFLVKAISHIEIYGGAIGVIGFIMVSAYFLDLYSFKLNKISALIFYVFLYSNLTLITVKVLNIFPVDKRSVIESILPIPYDAYWFFTIYLVIYFLSPMLKKGIVYMDKDSFKIVLIIYTIFFTLMPLFFLGSAEISSPTSEFIYIYLLINYLKKYPIKKLDNKLFCFAGFTFTLLLIICIDFGYSVLSNNYEFFKGFTSLASRRTYFLMILCTLFLFNYFRCLNIKHSKIINKVAASTFAIFLIHGAPALRKYIWLYLFKPDLWINSRFSIIFSLLSIVGMFVLCFIIDIIIKGLISILLVNKNFSRWNLLCKKVDERMNNMSR